MKLIGAGYGRTGTMSLKAALELIDHGPCFHMIDLIRDPSLLGPWADAAAGKPVDWQAALAGWGSTIDWPGCTFWEQHHETWPDAPVLLNVRDADAWYRSCEKTIYAVKQMVEQGQLHGNTENPPSPEVMAMINEIIWNRTFDGRFPDKAATIEIFHRHIAEVKAKVPADQLLVFDVKQGWEPLCTFLGVPIPDEPFPHLNDTASFREMFGMPAIA